MRLKLKTLILLMLLPALSIITILAGVWLYGGLYRIILDGFDRKLYALGTTTASFIDGDKLLSVLAPYDIHALAYAPGASVLYGVDLKTQHLMRIDPTNGCASPIAPLPEPGIQIMTHDAQTSLIAYAPNSQALVRIDAQSGALLERLPLTIQPTALTWHPTQGLLLMAGDTLYQWDDQAHLLNALCTGTWGVISGLAYDPRGDHLFALEGAKGRLLRIDLPSGATHEIGLLLPEGSRFGEVEYGEEAGELPAYDLAWNAQTETLYAAADRLMVLSPETGIAEGGLWMSTRYRNHRSETYEAIVGPMRKILDEKDITYLYTFNTGGRKDITYIIDASPDDGWCAIGFEETLPEQNYKGVHRSITEGVPFISDVLDYDLWGLLKVSSAPIYNDAGQIRALAGVDVNISVIRSKTRLALFQVLGIGALALLIAGGVSLGVTRRLIRPITQLRFGALRIAAGEYAYTLNVQAPTELHDLAASFNGIGYALDTTMRQKQTSNDQLEADRRRTELTKSIPQMVDTFPALRGQEIPATFHARWLDQRPNIADASGVVRTAQTCLAWRCAPEQDALNAVKERADRSLLLTGLALHAGADTEALQRSLEPLYAKQVTCWLGSDAAATEVWYIARTPHTVFHLRPGPSAEAIEITGSGSIALAPGEAIAMISHQGATQLHVQQQGANEATATARQWADLLEHEQTAPTGLLVVMARSPAV